MEFLTREDSDRLAARAGSMWLLGLYQSRNLSTDMFDGFRAIPLHYATLMDCRSHCILAARAGAGRMDRWSSDFIRPAELPRDICTSLKKEHRPAALLMPAEYPEAVEYYGGFLVHSCGFPADRIIWCRGRPLAVQSGMYLWHRQLDLWDRSRNPFVPYYPEDMNLDLEEFVRDRNRVALSPLEKEPPEGSYFRRLRKLSRLRLVPVPEDDEEEE